MRDTPHNYPCGWCDRAGSVPDESVWCEACECFTPLDDDELAAVMARSIPFPKRDVVDALKALHGSGFTVLPSDNYEALLNQRNELRSAAEQERVCTARRVVWICEVGYTDEGSQPVAVFESSREARLFESWWLRERGKGNVSGDEIILIEWEVGEVSMGLGAVSSWKEYDASAS